MKDFDETPRIERRVAMEWILSAAASVPFLGETAFAANSESAAPVSGKGYGPDPDMVKAYNPGDLWPLTFSSAQRELVITLSDIIIPADEQSPSASSQGVHDFVDEWISSPYPAQKSDRNLVLKGLAWLDEEAVRRGSANFVGLSDTEQVEICKELAFKPKEFPGNFFLKLRDLVAGGYYTTPLGMQDLGYRGNIPMPEWNGPPKEVLDLLGLEPE
ncbi:MAG: gluconate 2-dehydrogenase subunit 3 family protein [Verrucomicrobiales bacterium]|nr:gluconate 2-dehydrogenase subunit 3 family protein [Verrucomicrobiales bacterium]